MGFDFKSVLRSVNLQQTRRIRHLILITKNKMKKHLMRLSEGLVMIAAIIVICAILFFFMQLLFQVNNIVLVLVGTIILTYLAGYLAEDE